MQPVNVDGLAQYLGPGTGGLFMGEQQRNAMQESEINQQKGLEDILNQRQTRDIQKQKLPFELQQAEQNVLKAKGEVAKQATDAEDRLEKLDKQRVSDFMGDILQYQGVDNPLDNAFQLQALAQKHKLDGNDPRIRSIMTNSMDKAGIAKMQKALIESDPKWQADRKKAEEDLAKAREEMRSRERVGAGHDAATRYGADQRAATAALRQQATSKLASIDQRLVQLAAIINNPEAAPQAKSVAQQEANDLVRAKVTIQTAVAEEKWSQISSMFNPDAQKPQPTGPQPLYPTAPAPQPGAAKPAAPQPAGKITYQGQEYEVLEQLPDGKVKIRDPKTGRTGTITQ